MCQLLGLAGRCNVPILAIFKMHMQPPTNLEFTIKSLKKYNHVRGLTYPRNFNGLFLRLDMTLAPGLSQP